MNSAWVALLGAMITVPALAADVGVSVSINQPGLYGRVDIGRVPTPPVLVYPQPVVIVQSPVAVVQQPIYLRVPPGHAKDWRRHCGRYNACGQPVYFVQEGWYQQHYVVQRDSEWRDRDHDRREKHGRGHGRGHDKHDD